MSQTNEIDETDEYKESDEYGNSASSEEMKSEDNSSNPYVDETLMHDLAEFNLESNSEFLSEHAVHSFPKALEPPPEAKEYSLDSEDQQILDYLSSTYKTHIQEFNHFGDDIVFRFVSGYRHVDDFDERLQQTEQIFADYLQWRKSCEYETILNIKQINDVPVMQYIKGCFIYGQDIHGHPIFYDEGLKYHSDSDMRIYKECGEEGTDKVIGYLLQLLQKMKDATNKYYGLQTKTGHEQSEEEDDDVKMGLIRHCVVFDLSGLDVVRCLKDVSVHEYFFRRFSSLFPEMTHKAYVINTPWVFKTIWSLVKSFLHPNTVKKTVILGTDYHKVLFQEVDPDFVPKKYGGNGPWEIVYGGIPKDYPIQFDQ
eukprot:137745_1